MPLLSPRETQTLQLLANGLCYKEIACALGISRRSARVYVYRARKKLQQPDSHSAVALAAVLHLIIVLNPFDQNSCED